MTRAPRQSAGRPFLRWSYRGKLATRDWGGITRHWSSAVILAKKRICHMARDAVVTLRAPDESSPDLLTDLSRRGAQGLFTQAAEVELNTFLAAHGNQTDAEGRRRLVRHGHLSDRKRSRSRIFVHGNKGLACCGQCRSRPCQPFVATERAGGSSRLNSFGTCGLPVQRAGAQDRRRNISGYLATADGRR